MQFFSRTMTALACWAVLVQPIPAAAGDDELGVRLPHVVSHSAALVRATVWVPRDGDNRLLRITLDSGTFYRSSDVPLEGNRAAQSHTLEWHKLPPGSYEVTIELVGSMRVKQVIRRELQVMGLGT
jgi:hypothetical protein